MTDSRKSLRRPNKSPRSPKLDGTRPTAAIEWFLSVGSSLTLVWLHVHESWYSLFVNLVRQLPDLFLRQCGCAYGYATVCCTAPPSSRGWSTNRHAQSSSSAVCLRTAENEITTDGCGSKSGDARWALGRLTAARWRRHDPPCSRLHAIWMRGRANLRHVHHVETATRWPRLARYLRSVFCARRR